MKEGVHTPLSASWSPVFEYQGERRRYRMFYTPSDVYCLRLTEEQGGLRIEVSSSLENVDPYAEVIFDIPDFPFDAQLQLLVKQDRVSAFQAGSRHPADPLRVFGYRSLDRLIHDLTKGL